MIKQVQRKRLYFDPTPDRQRLDLPARPSKQTIRNFLAENNQKCPLNKIWVSQKNFQAMQGLRLAAYTALSRPDHSLKGCSTAIYAGPGQGKTTLAKAFAQTVGIPFAFIQSDSLSGTWQLFEILRTTFDEAGYSLVPQGPRQFVVPPCIVFFDEAHNLSTDLRTGGLLNVMESKDGWLRTSSPKGEQHLVDCGEVCWMAATTDPGLLFKQSQAFYSRFDNHMVWHSAGDTDVARIVKSDYPQLSHEACVTVAKYAKIPRQAISFAKQMIAQADMMGESFEEAAKVIAAMNGIDEHGYQLRQIAVLKALGQRPYSKNNLLVAAKCRIEELEAMVLPYLIEDVEGRGSLIVVTPRGCMITEAGLRELDKRELPHNGKDVTAEQLTA
jgi:Holliday junction resolvasome RuvABC ATP-dependent DNA helicase subunit